MKPIAPYKLFKMPFAAEKGAREIIERADEVDIGRANLAEGFPECTQKPLNLGGVAPNRMDFNGILNMLSAFAFWQQSGGLFTFSEKLGYAPPALVWHRDDLWLCKRGNGPDYEGVGVKVPGEDGSEDYWEALYLWLGRKLGLLDEKQLILLGDTTGSATYHLSDHTIRLTTTVGQLTGGKVIKVTGDAQGTAEYTLAGNVIDLKLNVPALRAPRMLKLTGDVTGFASYQLVDANSLAPQVALQATVPALTSARQLKLTGDVTGTANYRLGDTAITLQTRDANKTARKTLRLTGDVTGSATFTLADDAISVSTNGNPILAKVPDPVPVGCIIPYWGTSAPSGYFVCDGQSFSASSYPKLYRALGKSVTPNLVGEFIRGGTRAGTKQEDAGRNIKGAFGIDDRSFNFSPTGPFYHQGQADTASKGTEYGHVMGFDASRCWGNAHTASEFRPRNTSVLFCIKHD